MARRSFWAWGMESEEPTPEAQHKAALHFSRRYGVSLEAVPPPTLADLTLREPRITPPSTFSSFSAS